MYTGPTPAASQTLKAAVRNISCVGGVWGRVVVVISEWEEPGLVL